MRRKIFAGAVVLLFMMAISVPVVNAPSSEYDNLKKGDLVYRSGARGFGHVGIYIGDGKVIEVTTKKVVPPYGGAREISLEDFKKEGKYWGAKTVEGLDEKRRHKIVEFAIKKVEETKEGRIQYKLTGKGSVEKNGRQSFSCVGFSEEAYQSAAIDLVPGDKTFFKYLTPKGQMKSSKLKDVLSELPEGKDLGGIDFSSAQLNSISVFLNQNEQNFSYILKAKKAEKGDEIINIEDAEALSLNSFLTGLTLPETEFWVNLNPWEPDRIIEKDLETTDVGRIMLEADLQMKKNFGKYENPCESEIGGKCWNLLEEKRGELTKDFMKKYPDEIKDVNNIKFIPVTRYWIVPDKVDAYETDNEIYIINATLNIFSEPVYEHSTYKIVNQNTFFMSKSSIEDLSEAAKEYGRYAKELEEKMILPLVVNEVNHGKNYSDLRQVYISLALAQWYKNKYRYTTSLFAYFIDSKDLKGLESKSAWSAESIWKDYKKSFEEGDYHCWKNETYQRGDYIITESKFYSGGGIDFMDIKITNRGDIPKNLKELISEVVYSSFAKDGDDYYFGDGIYVSYEEKQETGHGDENRSQNDVVPEEQQETIHGHSNQENNQTNTQTMQETPGFEAIFAVIGLLTIVYLIRRMR